MDFELVKANAMLNVELLGISEKISEKFKEDFKIFEDKELHNGRVIRELLEENAELMDKLCTGLVDVYKEFGYHTIETLLFNKEDGDDFFIVAYYSQRLDFIKYFLNILNKQVIPSGNFITISLQLFYDKYLFPNAWRFEYRSNKNKYRIIKLIQGFNYYLKYTNINHLTEGELSVNKSRFKDIQRVVMNNINNEKINSDKDLTKLLVEKEFLLHNMFKSLRDKSITIYMKDVADMSGDLLSSVFNIVGKDA